MSFSVRPTTVDDAEPLVLMHLRALRETYGQFLPESAFANREARVPERVARQRPMIQNALSHWLAIDDDGVLGFAQVESARDEPAPAEVELRGLYILARGYGTGAGKALVDAALGPGPAYVWVLEQNDRAAAFYRKMGFELNGVRQELPPEWHGLWEMQMVRS